MSSLGYVLLVLRTLFCFFLPLFLPVNDLVKNLEIGYVKTVQVAGTLISFRDYTLMKRSLAFPKRKGGHGIMEVICWGFLLANLDGINYYGI
ncbi:hypothetical protein B0T21DRAFT_368618 [Apiosordaria backusii]|uniref:Uncharacterized protein n=1 Tax=Apiosordaria backusii TaxID=314023 RepID=A0AA40EEV6_9PEZI|nr:hypothetical protein B0T21DRAFT_368618 [Apiosordaria backusii]